jgi:hypothetical protein
VNFHDSSTRFLDNKIISKNPNIFSRINVHLQIVK